MELLTELSTIGSRLGETRLHWEQGGLAYITHVNLSNAPLAKTGVFGMIETLLDPFNVKILAMRMVLDGEMSADVAVQSYAAWHRQRFTSLAEKLRRAGESDSH